MIEAFLQKRLQRYCFIMRLQNILTEYLSLLPVKMIYINPKGIPSTIITPITMAQAHTIQQESATGNTHSGTATDSETWLCNKNMPAGSRTEEINARETGGQNGMKLRATHPDSPYLPPASPDSPTMLRRATRPDSPYIPPWHAKDISTFWHAEHIS